MLTLLRMMERLSWEKDKGNSLWTARVLTQTTGLKERTKLMKCQASMDLQSKVARTLPGLLIKDYIPIVMMRPY